MTKIKNRFECEPYDSSDKYIEIFENGRGSHQYLLRMHVDYDDVFHPVIRKKVKKLIDILNREWGKDNSKKVDSDEITKELNECK